MILSCNQESVMSCCFLVEYSFLTLLKLTMKVMVTGASGLLGRAICKEFKSATNWEIIGVGYTRATSGLLKLDLCKSGEVSRFIEKYKPDVVIHSAAERRPDYVINHKEQTRKLNVTATETIAKCVNKYGGFVLYISSDYVFDGSNPPYKPADKPCPVNDYGVSKLAGEKAVLEFCKHSGVLRVPILYGDLEYLKESAVTGLLDLLLTDSTQVVKVSNYEQRYPTNTADVAVVCRQIVQHKQKHEDFNGIWHWSSIDQMTKYNMLQIISRVCNKSILNIVPDFQPTKGVLRPFDCQLDCSDLISLGIGSYTHFERSMERILSKFI